MANFRSPSRAALNAIKAALIGALIAAPSPSPAQSAKTSSTVSVTISGPVSAIALTTGIRFSTIGLPGASPGGTPAAAPAAPAATGSLVADRKRPGGGRRQPAGGLTVSGEAGQAFPSRCRSGHHRSQRRLLELRDSATARHDASTGADGATRIAFVADFNRDQWRSSRGSQRRRPRRGPSSLKSPPTPSRRRASRWPGTTTNRPGRKSSRPAGPTPSGRRTRRPRWFLY